MIAVGRRPQAWVILTCLVAALGYSGAVTTPALLGYVLPGVLVAALLAARAQATVPAAATVGAWVLGWAVAVNVLSGLTNGPAARSTATASLFAALAARSLHVRVTTLFLVPVLGVLGGALALGAGAEVRSVAVATAVLATASLASIERDSRRLVGARTHSLTVPLMCLLVALAGVGAVVLQATFNDRSPAVPFPLLVDGAITPGFDPLREETVVPTAAPSAASAGPSTIAEPSPEIRESSGAWLWVLAAALVAVTSLLGLVLRVLMVSLRWRRLRRELDAGTPGERIAGAWVWARRRLASAGTPLPRDLSPDVAATHPLEGLDVTVAEPLQVLAGLVTPAVFSASFPESQVTAAWVSSDSAGRAAQDRLSRRRRLAARLATPYDEANGP